MDRARIASAMRRFSVMGRDRISAWSARARLVPEVSVVAAMTSPSTAAAIGGGGGVGKSRGVAGARENGQVRALNIGWTGYAGVPGWFRQTKGTSPHEYHIRRRRPDHSTRYRVGSAAVRPVDVLSDVDPRTAGREPALAEPGLYRPGQRAIDAVYPVLCRANKTSQHPDR